MSKMQAMRQRACDWGWSRAIHWEFMNLLARSIGLRVNRLSIAADRPESFAAPVPPAPAGYTVRWGAKEDLLPFADRIRALDRAFVDEAFARGDQCVVTFHGDVLVGFSFVSRSWAPVTQQLRIRIPPGFRYGYKAWTHSDHRRSNLSNVRQQFWRRSYAARFEERTLGYIETHNYPSLLHSYRHPNQRGLRFGYIGWITVFGRQIPFCSRLARRLGVRLTRTV